jgi:hypothetical protein
VKLCTVCSIQLLLFFVAGRRSYHLRYAALDMPLQLLFVREVREYCW